MTSSQPDPRFNALAGDVPASVFADLVKSASDAELSQVLADRNLRERAIREIFAQMQPRFRPEKAAKIDATVHWEIGDPPDRWEVRISHGSCSVTDQPQVQKATVTFALTDIAFLRLMAGEVTGMKLMLTRKLKVRGDMMFAPRVEQLFRTDPGALEVTL